MIHRRISASAVVFLALALGAVAGSNACARYGNLGAGLGTTLTGDLTHAPCDRSADPAHPGGYTVDAQGLTAHLGDYDIPVALYRPRGLAARAPAVVFLPGRFAPEDQYESYARLLASQGFVVVVRGRYGWLHPDELLTHEAIELGDWLRALPDVDPDRVGVAGHSMGARDAIWAAFLDPRFRAVVAIDPGGDRSPPIINGVVGKLHVPLLLIGAEVGWRAWSVCAPRDTNYEHFFDHSPPGTVELTLRDADHVQLMDAPERFGYSVCRVGSADSTEVRVLARRATAQFMGQYMNHAEPCPLEFGNLATVRVRGEDSPGVTASRGDEHPAR